MRKRLIRRLLWVAGFGCLWLPVLDDPPLATDPYLQRVTPDGVTVAMITPTPAELHCEVRNGAGAVVRSVTGPSRRRHALRMDGLEPGATYTYSVSDRGEVVGAGTFRTSPVDDAAPVRFAFLGDSGGQPWWVWLQTAPALYLPARWQWLPPRDTVARIGDAVADFQPDFLLHLGDVVYPWGRHCHYSAGFFRPFARALRDAPVYVTLGNHDVMDTGGLQVLANFDLPGCDLTGDSRCYSFSYGSLRVISLDCTAMFGALLEPGHPSYEFLAAELPRCSEPWVIVVSHYPMRSASRQGDRADLLLSLRPLLEEYAVSLYLSGHDHCYQRFGPTSPAERDVPLIVSGGGGKSLYDVHPVRGRPALALRSAYHWCSAEIEGPVLQVRAHGLEGEIFDELRLEHVPGDMLARIREINPERARRITALF